MPTTRHLNTLLDRLDRVLDIGCAEVTPTELKLWFDRERLSHRDWAEIRTHWLGLLASTRHLKEADRRSSLLVGIGDRGQTIVFAFGRGLITSENSWFQDIRTLANIEFTPGDPEQIEG